MYQPKTASSSFSGMRGITETIDRVLDIGGSAYRIFHPQTTVQTQSILGTGAQSIGTGTLVLIGGAVLLALAMSRKKR